MSLTERMEELGLIEPEVPGGFMRQPFFCYYLNGFTLENIDCCGCNKCGRLKPNGE